MADISSELPIRSQLPGQTNYDDILIKVADGTAGASQLLGIDASGRVSVKLFDGAGTAITSQANGLQRALDVGINVGGVQIDPRQIRALTAADVVTADQGGTWTVGLSEDHNYGVVGATTLRAAAQIGNATGAADFNFGAAGAQTLRVAALPGNATGLADFNNGATGAQTLRVAANLAVGGANVSGTNPVPVSITSAPVGTSVNNYNTAASVAAGATSNHIYTITATKTFQGKKIWASASGSLKIEVRVSPDGSTYSTLWVGFNSTANPNITIDLNQLVFLESGTGATIEVIRTNEDKQAQDVYSTISGTEV